MNLPPCPDNWQHCDFCGAKPNETCRNPDVSQDPERTAADAGRSPAQPRLPGLEGGDEGSPEAHPVPRLDRAAAEPAEVGPRCLVGLIGHKGSGKDTAAEVYGQYGYTNLKFAEPLKDMLRVIFRAAGDDEATIERRIDGDLKEMPCAALRGKTPRFAMQTLGTEWGRDTIGDDIWTNLLAMRAKAEDMVVVTDVRFPNEVETIYGLGGRMIGVHRPDLDPDLSHPSEQFVFEFDPDYSHFNEGNRAEFQDSVEDDIIVWGLGG